MPQISGEVKEAAKTDNDKLSTEERDKVSENDGQIPDKRRKGNAEKSCKCTKKETENACFFFCTYSAHAPDIFSSSTIRP